MHPCFGYEVSVGNVDIETSILMNLLRGFDFFWHGVNSDERGVMENYSKNAFPVLIIMTPERSVF